MFHEEKKMLIELKVLRSKLSEVDRLYYRSIKMSKLGDMRQLEEKKYLVEQRIKEIEAFLYPDVIA